MPRQGQDGKDQLLNQGCKIIPNIENIYTFCLILSNDGMRLFVLRIWTKKISYKPSI